MRYLGVIIDRHLTFGPHVRLKVKQAKQKVMRLQSMLGSFLGLNPRLLRWSYRQIVLSSLSYGAHMWAPAIDRRAKAELRKVNRLASSA